MEVPVLILHYEKYETNATSTTLLCGFFLDKDIDSDCDSLSSHHDALNLNALADHLLNKPLDNVRTRINTANPIILATIALQSEEKIGLLLSVFLAAFLANLLVPVMLMEHLSHLRLVKYTDF
eukprot:7003769-Ditylum_brightwellii.AAC.1